MAVSQQQVEAVVTGSGSRIVWSFANDVLYRMCSEYPDHRQDEIIMGKIWLIGRSYAAALERRMRRKDPNQYESDELYRKFAAALKEADFDRQLRALKSFQHIDAANITAICSVHAFLMDIFRTLTGSDKRSLASKYLHFHYPDLFFIYDSFAVNALKTHLPHRAKRNPPDAQVDQWYFQFCEDMLVFRNEIHQEYGHFLTPRQLDDLLLER